jgi:hypothetical protein
MPDVTLVSAAHELFGAVMALPAVDDIHRLDGMTFTAHVLKHADLRFRVASFDAQSTDVDSFFATASNRGWFRSDSATTATSHTHSSTASGVADQIVSRMQRVPFRMVLRDVRSLDGIEGLPSGITDAQEAIRALANQYRDDPSLGVRMLVRQTDGKLGAARVEFDGGVYPTAQGGGIEAGRAMTAQGFAGFPGQKALDPYMLDLAPDDPRIRLKPSPSRTLLDQRALVNRLVVEDKPGNMREAQQLGRPRRRQRRALEDLAREVGQAQDHGWSVEPTRLHEGRVAALRVGSSLPTDGEIAAAEQEIEGAKAALADLERRYEQGKSAPPNVHLVIPRKLRIERADQAPKVERLDLTGHRAPDGYEQLPDEQITIRGGQVRSSGLSHGAPAWLEVDPPGDTAIHWDADARPDASFTTSNERGRVLRYTPPLDPSTPDTAVLYEVPDQSAVALVGPDGVVPLHMDASS